MLWWIVVAAAAAGGAGFAVVEDEEEKQEVESHLDDLWLQKLIQHPFQTSGFSAKFSHSRLRRLFLAVGFCSWTACSA